MRLSGVSPVNNILPALHLQKKRKNVQGRRNPLLAWHVCAASSSSSSSSSTGHVRLYGSSGSRSPLVSFYLHEINVPFELINPRDETNPHPMGQVPALRDGLDLEVWESGAILMYLADKYGGLDTPEKRAEVGKWVVWANATLDPCLFIETPEGKVIDTSVRSSKPARPLVVLENHLASKTDEDPYVVSGGFSAADAAIGSYLLYVSLFFPDVSYAAYPNICKYMKLVCTRDAYREAFGAPMTDSLIAKVDDYLNECNSPAQQAKSVIGKLFS